MSRKPIKKTGDGEESPTNTRSKETFMGWTLVPRPLAAAHSDEPRAHNSGYSWAYDCRKHTTGPPKRNILGDVLARRIGLFGSTRRSGSYSCIWTLAQLIQWVPAVRGPHCPKLKRAGWVALCKRPNWAALWARRLRVPAGTSAFLSEDLVVMYEMVSGQTFQSGSSSGSSLSPTQCLRYSFYGGPFSVQTSELLHAPKREISSHCSCGTSSLGGCHQPLQVGVVIPGCLD